MLKPPRQSTYQQDFQAQKRLGQNFLRSKKALVKIIMAAELKKTDVVLEIGPGEGVLTEALTAAAGRVIAVEKDKRLIPGLRERFKSNKNVEIVESDIRELLVVSSKGQVVRKKTSPYYILPTTNYKVVANLPYYLATHLIRLFLESPHPPELMVLMVQKEVAQRIVAKPPYLNLLAISVQFYAEAKIIGFVPKSSFWPKPKVDSAIIKLQPHQFHKLPKIHDRGFFVRLENRELFFRIVKAGFGQPRKTLVNNLSRGLKMPKGEISEKLVKIGLNPNCRSENLSLNDWVKLIKKLTD